MQEVNRFDLYGLKTYIKRNRRAYKVLISVFRGSNSLSEIKSDTCLEDNDLKRHLDELAKMGIIEQKKVQKKVNYKNTVKIIEYSMSNHSAKHQLEIYNMAEF